MKFKNCKKLILFILFCILTLFLFSFYPPFSKLTEVKTEHFIIYYQPKIENIINDEYINWMEQAYTFLSYLFNFNIPGKVYVYFSDLEKAANGFASPVGQRTIYIITTPIEASSSLSNMDNWLKLVFYHELTHQFSLSIKNDFDMLLSYVFGNIFLSNLINLPEFMIEGVTTSLEGREKELGRVYNPEIKQFLMQELIDGNFKNPYEISSSYEKWPYGSIIYWYGGFFSLFLQKNYPEKFYFDLFRQTSYFGFEQACQNIYGKSLLQLWDEFTIWLQPDFDISSTYSDIISPKKSSYLSNARMIKTDKSLYYYYYDRNIRGICRIDLNTNKNEVLFKNLYSFYSFDISYDNRKLLLSYYDYEGSNPCIKSKIYDISSADDSYKPFKPHELKYLKNIREISFFEDSYIGIDTDNSKTSLVIIDSMGEKKTLVEGNDNFYISTPKFLDPSNIVFIGTVKGDKKIYRYNLLENKIIKIMTDVNYINYLNTFEGSIFFSYNNDFTFNKFGMIRDDRIALFEKNFSGGIQEGFYYGQNIYYIGMFSDKFRLLKINVNLDSIDEPTTSELLKKMNDSYVKIINTANVEVTKEEIQGYKEKYDDFSTFFKENLSESSETQVKDSENSGKKAENSENVDKDNFQKSTIIYPFNENLIFDFWLPMTNFYYKNTVDIYLFGLGPTLFFLGPVSSSFATAGIYYNFALDPPYFSFYTEFLNNYFYPVQILLCLGQLNLPSDTEKVQINILDVSLKYTIDYIPSGNYRSFILNFHFLETKTTGVSNIIDTDHLFSVSLQMQSNLDFWMLGPLKISDTSLLYFSRFNDLNNFKMELTQKLYIKDLFLILENQLSYSYYDNLGFSLISDYFDMTICDFNYESYAIYGEMPLNFIDTIYLKAVILESSDSPLLKFLIGIEDLALYCGMKLVCFGSIESLASSFSFNSNYDLYYFIELSLVYIENIAKLDLFVSFSRFLDRNFVYLTYSLYIF
ncbi:MAG TPA: hypothetical protein PK520_01195 [Exilispira sp.]|nr:hypothetical protein [Exilispira sp.]